MAMPLSRRDLLKAGIATGGAVALPGLLAESMGATLVQAAQTIQLTMLQAGDIHPLRLMQKLMDTFHKRYPNIVVKPSVAPWANFDQRVDLLRAPGTPPAVWWPGANRGYRYYAARNYFPSIDGQLA